MCDFCSCVAVVVYVVVVAVLIDIVVVFFGWSKLDHLDQGAILKRCHVSGVMYHVYNFLYIFSIIFFLLYLYFFLLSLNKVGDLVSGGFVINGAYPI